MGLAEKLASAGEKFKLCQIPSRLVAAETTDSVSAFKSAFPYSSILHESVAKGNVVGGSMLMLLGCATVQTRTGPMGVFGIHPS